MKNKELLENMDPLLPADFFSCSFEIPHVKDLLDPLHKKGNLVPDVSDLLGEESFACVSLAWNEEGIVGKVWVEKPFEAAFFPEYEKGDSLEIFIDTRDHKKKGFASRFCHHFLFLAGEVNGIQAQEITRFRSEDTHPLCNSSDLSVSCHLSEKSYELTFQIKESALHGFDPSQFPRIGFAYALNRYKAKSQYFPVSSPRFDLLQHPSLWASVSLT